ncbi:hypothetical protein CC78DRAFT_545378 [Lojkania enalia]|uniref:Micro-fibrillar-associated protein 1 C-terminal domain-containing protein n=1 Tax=Lojkania enalia TaxID=147567 RepID=A0A9P4K5J1_9PLEO|nr:hypothetical protein CC78DRAFT_545378 [Didymosphaeria enalia]
MPTSKSQPLIYLMSHVQVISTCSKQRLDRGWDHLQEIGVERTMKGIGEFLKWVQRDVLVKEKGCIEGNGVNEELLRTEIIRVARPWYPKKHREAEDVNLRHGSSIFKMPPPRSKKMTAQPVRTRHFAGKPGALEVEQPSSEEESSSEEEPQKKLIKPRSAPLASSFPKSALKSNFASRQKREEERKRLEAEFETESEGESVEDNSENESQSEETVSSSEEEESSEDEAPKKLLRPVFLRKSQRNLSSTPAKSADELAAEEEARRQQQTRSLVQEQIEQRAAEKAAGRRDWDDNVEEVDINAVDDTDNVDPEAEYAAWKLRELKRIRRERVAIEEVEKEREEIERRKNLSAAEREAEDREFIEKQKEERGDRSQMQYMQKYFHKGAFFNEELKELGVDKRNVMGARFEDSTNREVLPEYMQIRDMTKLGKKGRTRYKDMRSEDTGRWADYGERRGPKGDSWDRPKDERFQSDSYRDRRDRDERYIDETKDRKGATGANARPLGQRKRFGEESSRERKRSRVDER